MRSINLSTDKAVHSRIDGKPTRPTLSNIQDSRIIMALEKLEEDCIGMFSREEERRN